MEITCQNKKCGRLIADVADKAMLPDRLRCQHCHRSNVIRIRKPAPELIEPAPDLEEGTGPATGEEIIAPAPGSEEQSPAEAEEPTGEELVPGSGESAPETEEPAEEG